MSKVEFACQAYPIIQVEIDSAGRVEYGWSSGSRRNIQIGDTVFLLRQGNTNPGIIGHGIIQNRGEMVSHWDKEQNSKNKSYNKVQVVWDSLYKEPLLSRDELNKYVANTKLWVTRSGGVEIPQKVLAKLELLWEARSKVNKQGGVAKIESDNVMAGATDHLNVTNEANAFARVAASKNIQPPLSFGVFGEWGSGLIMKL